MTLLVGCAWAVLPVPGVVANRRCLQAEEHLQKNMHQKHSAQGSHGSDISVDCVANKYVYTVSPYSEGMDWFL